MQDGMSVKLLAVCAVLSVSLAACGGGSGSSVAMSSDNSGGTINSSTGGGGGTSGGSGTTTTLASDCLNVGLLSAGSTWHLEYDKSGDATGTLVSDATVSGSTIFQGNAAMEIVQTIVDTSQAGSVRAESKNYQRLDGASILSFGMVADVSGALAGSVNIVSIPPQADNRYTLAAGESSTSHRTVVNIKNFPAMSGIVFVPQTSSSASILTVTYAGRETVTVPAGTFDACRFDTRAGDASAALTSSEWIVPASGVVVRMVSYSNGNPALTTTLRAGTLNGTVIK